MGTFLMVIVVVRRQASRAGGTPSGRARDRRVNIRPTVTADGRVRAGRRNG
ncbi:hypothetical protein ACFY3U_05915 [Micromonospora sp. NPDC000089]|uniref:hypothetical protein n=1 Tax=unclassified Micromonospora TaxID=2617518 RepID=UPI0036973A0A